ncbi:hypothetical protein KIW84_051580 [Lathyrus oleraceus]|uniref:PWWP domain-containing protein n=1 Tax=Pisum sativum TaxID=3888 RepID=A0A9D4WPG7_PEA|nr:hypothetical protein KIW84_051580 [Pisum sativum]
MEGGNNQVTEDYSVAFGDLIHVKLPRSGLWWPAQVVDDEAVVSSLKPRSCRKGEVLVRVYGSHLFLNVDPVKSCSEFETILKNNNGDLQKILREGLEKVIVGINKIFSYLMVGQRIGKTRHFHNICLYNAWSRKGSGDHCRKMSTVKNVMITTTWIVAAVDWFVHPEWSLEALLFGVKLAVELILRFD